MTTVLIFAAGVVVGIVLAFELLSHESPKRGGTYGREWP